MEHSKSFATPLVYSNSKSTAIVHKETKSSEISHCCLLPWPLRWERLCQPQSQTLRNPGTVEWLHHFVRLSFHPKIEGTAQSPLYKLYKDYHSLMSSTLERRRSTIINHGIFSFDHFLAKIIK